MSVTNDIDAVLEELSHRLDLRQRPIIYRDTSGVWDGIDLEDGRFRRFYFIGTRDLLTAIRAARTIGSFLRND